MLGEIGAFGLTFGFFSLKWLLQKRAANSQPVSDETRLRQLSIERSCSTFDIFNDAASTWNLSREKADADFRHYLKGGDLPHYVRHYLRLELEKKAIGYQTRLFTEDNQPPFWF